MLRRTYLGSALAALLGILNGTALAQSERNLVSVWKTPTCGCCKAWIQHLEANGFKVRAIDVPDTTPIRRDLKMPASLGSCHTAVVEGYVIEGHVPASEIKRLLKERPRALGLAVPGMPIGSPGMEMGTKKDPYKVLLVIDDSTTRVFKTYS